MCCPRFFPVPVQCSIVKCSSGSGSKARGAREISATEKGEYFGGEISSSALDGLTGPQTGKSRLHEAPEAQWYARLDIFGLETCPKRYERTGYESTLKGEL